MLPDVGTFWLLERFVGNALSSIGDYDMPDNGTNETYAVGTVPGIASIRSVFREKKIC